jgi:hypothetical protein
VKASFSLWQVAQSRLSRDKRTSEKSFCPAPLLPCDRIAPGTGM